MKEFIVNTKNDVVRFNLPTNLKELSKEYLKEVTDDVVVAPNYTLIGLVYHEALPSIIITCRNKKKNASIGVIPIFIKSGDSDKSIVDSAEIGQKLLIDGTQLQLAHHCAVPKNKLTLDYFAKTIDQTIDRDLYEQSLKDNKGEEVLFVEFKIVPNCQIMALYKDSDTKVNNPYVSSNTNTAK